MEKPKKTENKQNKSGDPSQGHPTDVITSKKSRSGAQRRRRKLQRQSELGTPDAAKAGPSTQPKRQRSEDSPAKKEEQPSKRSKTSVTTGSKPQQKTYKDAVSGIQMAIVHEDYPNQSITQEQANLIRSKLIEEMDKLEIGGPQPQFDEARHRGGVLRMSCVDTETCMWLAGALEACVPWDGAKLKLVRESELVRFVRTMVWVPGPAGIPETVLHRLGVQNQKLRMSSWRVVDARADPKGQQLVVTMDERSWKTLQDHYHCSLRLNFSKVTFKLLGGRKAGEEGKVQQDIEAKTEESSCKNTVPTEVEMEGDTADSSRPGVPIVSAGLPAAGGASGTESGPGTPDTAMEHLFLETPEEEEEEEVKKLVET